MNIFIQLTSAGLDSGPFNLFSDTNGFTTPFAINIGRSVLLAGYASSACPEGTSTVRIKSVGKCTNFIDVVVANNTTSTSSTSSTTTSSTTLSPCDTYIYEFTGYLCGGCIISGGGAMATSLPLVVGKYYYSPDIVAVVRIDSFISCNFSGGTTPENIIQSSQQDSCINVICP